MLKTLVFDVSLADKQSVILPFEYVKEFISKGHKRAKIKAENNKKCIEFYAALRVEKTGVTRIYFSKAKQKELDIFPNDYFKIQLIEDNSKYGVDISEELEAVLSTDYEAFTIFEALTAGKQRSIIYAISRYKNSQTRIDKALILCENLKRGIKDPKLWLKMT